MSEIQAFIDAFEARLASPDAKTNHISIGMLVPDAQALLHALRELALAP